MKTTAYGILVLWLAGATAQAGLLEYVSKADTSYSWSRISDGQADHGTSYVQLRMTSQTWRGIPWKHDMEVIRPKGAEKSAHALLIISGGSWRPGQEPMHVDKTSREFRSAVEIAQAAKMPVAFIRQVPFQPLFDDLTEDQLVSHTFDKFLNTGEADWPLLLPMTKTAVRAMDTVQEFARKEWGPSPSEFIVCGASKRGWTTWLTAVADPRVKGIVPMVFDSLNMPEQMKHQKETWGDYSEEIDDYSKLNLPDRLDTERGRELISIVDPYVYRLQLSIPKLLMMGTNDRYWTLDAANCYYEDLPGEKHLLYVPNVGHKLDDRERVISDLAAFALEISGKLTFPKLTWDIKEDGRTVQMTIQSEVKPAKVSAWTSRSATKDFREVKWKSKPIERDGDAYNFNLPHPQNGYAAVFGEVFYEIDDRPLYLSTNIRVIGKP